MDYTGTITPSMEEKLLKIISEYISKRKSKNFGPKEARKLLPELLNLIEFDKNKVTNSLNNLPAEQSLKDIDFLSLIKNAPPFRERRKKSKRGELTKTPEAKPKKTQRRQKSETHSSFSRSNKTMILNKSPSTRRKSKRSSTLRRMQTMQASGMDTSKTSIRRSHTQNSIDFDSWAKKMIRRVEPSNMNHIEFISRVGLHEKTLRDVLLQADVVEALSQLIDLAKLELSQNQYVNIVTEFKNWLQGPNGNLNRPSFSDFLSRVNQWYLKNQPAFGRLRPIKQVNTQGYLLITLSVIRDYLKVQDFYAQKGKTSNTANKKLEVFSGQIQSLIKAVVRDSDLNSIGVSQKTLKKEVSDMISVISKLGSVIRGDQAVQKFVVEALSQYENQERYLRSEGKKSNRTDRKKRKNREKKKKKSKSPLRSKSTMSEVKSPVVRSKTTRSKSPVVEKPKKRTSESRTSRADVSQKQETPSIATKTSTLLYQAQNRLLEVLKKVQQCIEKSQDGQIEALTLSILESRNKLLSLWKESDQSFATNRESTLKTYTDFTIPKLNTEILYVMRLKDSDRDLRRGSKSGADQEEVKQEINSLKNMLLAHWFQAKESQRIDTPNFPSEGRPKHKDISFKGSGETNIVAEITQPKIPEIKHLEESFTSSKNMAVFASPEGKTENRQIHSNIEPLSIQSPIQPINSPSPGKPQNLPQFNEQQHPHNQAQSPHRFLSPFPNASPRPMQSDYHPTPRPQDYFGSPIPTDYYGTPLQNEPYGRQMQKEYYGNFAPDEYYRSPMPNEPMHSPHYRNPMVDDYGSPMHNPHYRKLMFDEYGSPINNPHYRHSMVDEYGSPIHNPYYRNSMIDDYGSPIQNEHYGSPMHNPYYRNAITHDYGNPTQDEQYGSPMHDPHYRNAMAGEYGNDYYGQEDPYKNLLQIPRPLQLPDQFPPDYQYQSPYYYDLPEQSAQNKQRERKKFRSPTLEARMYNHESKNQSSFATARPDYYIPSEVELKGKEMQNGSHSHRLQEYYKAPDEFYTIPEGGSEDRFSNGSISSVEIEMVPDSGENSRHSRKLKTEISKPNHKNPHDETARNSKRNMTHIKVHDESSQAQQHGEENKDSLIEIINLGELDSENIGYDMQSSEFEFKAQQPMETPKDKQYPREESKMRSDLNASREIIQQFRENEDLNHVKTKEIKSIDPLREPEGFRDDEKVMENSRLTPREINSQLGTEKTEREEFKQSYQIPKLILNTEAQEKHVHLQDNLKDVKNEEYRKQETPAITERKSPRESDNEHHLKKDWDDTEKYQMEQKKSIERKETKRNAPDIIEQKLDSKSVEPKENMNHIRPKEKEIQENVRLEELEKESDNCSVEDTPEIESKPETIHYNTKNKISETKNPEKDTPQIEFKPETIPEKSKSSTETEQKIYQTDQIYPQANQVDKTEVPKLQKPLLIQGNEAMISIKSKNKEKTKGDDSSDNFKHAKISKNTEEKSSLEKRESKHKRTLREEKLHEEPNKEVHKNEVDSGIVQNDTHRPASIHFNTRKPENEGKEASKIPNIDEGIQKTIRKPEISHAKQDLQDLERTHISKEKHVNPEFEKEEVLPTSSSKMKDSISETKMKVSDNHPELRIEETKSEKIMDTVIKNESIDPSKQLEEDNTPPQIQKKEVSHEKIESAKLEAPAENLKIDKLDKLDKPFALHHKTYQINPLPLEREDKKEKILQENKIIKQEIEELKQEREEIEGNVETKKIDSRSNKEHAKQEESYRSEQSDSQSKPHKLLENPKFEEKKVLNPENKEPTNAQASENNFISDKNKSRVKSEEKDHPTEITSNPKKETSEKRTSRRAVYYYGIQNSNDHPVENKQKEDTPAESNKEIQLFTENAVSNGPNDTRKPNISKSKKDLSSKNKELNKEKSLHIDTPLYGSSAKSKSSGIFKRKRKRKFSVIKLVPEKITPDSHKKEVEDEPAMKDLYDGERHLETEALKEPKHEDYNLKIHTYQPTGDLMVNPQHIPQTEELEGLTKEQESKNIELSLLSEAYFEEISNIEKCELSNSIDDLGSNELFFNSDKMNNFKNSAEDRTKNELILSNKHESGSPIQESVKKYNFINIHIIPPEQPQDKEMNSQKETLPDGISNHQPAEIMLPKETRKTNEPHIEQQNQFDDIEKDKFSVDIIDEFESNPKFIDKGDSENAKKEEFKFIENEMSGVVGKYESHPVIKNETEFCDRDEPRMSRQDEPELLRKNEPEIVKKNEVEMTTKMPEVHIKDESEVHRTNEPEIDKKNEVEVNTKMPEVHIKDESEVHRTNEPEIVKKNEIEVKTKMPEVHIKDEPEVIRTNDAEILRKNEPEINRKNEVDVSSKKPEIIKKNEVEMKRKDETEAFRKNEAGFGDSHLPETYHKNELELPIDGEPAIKKEHDTKLNEIAIPENAQNADSLKPTIDTNMITKNKDLNEDIISLPKSEEIKQTKLRNLKLNLTKLGKNNKDFQTIKTKLGKNNEESLETTNMNKKPQSTIATNDIDDKEKNNPQKLTIDDKISQEPKIKSPFNLRQSEPPKNPTIATEKIKEDEDLPAAEEISEDEIISEVDLSHHEDEAKPNSAQNITHKDQLLPNKLSKEISSKNNHQNDSDESIEELSVIESESITPEPNYKTKEQQDTIAQDNLPSNWTSSLPNHQIYSTARNIQTETEIRPVKKQIATLPPEKESVSPIKPEDRAVSFKKYHHNISLKLEERGRTSNSRSNIRESISDSQDKALPDPIREKESSSHAKEEDRMNITGNAPNNVDSLTKNILNINKRNTINPSISFNKEISEDRLPDSKNEPSHHVFSKYDTSRVLHTNEYSPDRDQPKVKEASSKKLLIKESAEKISQFNKSISMHKNSRNSHDSVISKELDVQLDLPSFSPSLDYDQAEFSNNLDHSAASKNLPESSRNQINSTISQKPRGNSNSRRRNESGNSEIPDAVSATTKGIQLKMNIKDAPANPEDKFYSIIRRDDNFLKNNIPSDIDFTHVNRSSHPSAPKSKPLVKPLGTSPKSEDSELRFSPKALDRSQSPNSPIFQLPNFRAILSLKIPHTNSHSSAPRSHFAPKHRREFVSEEHGNYPPTNTPLHKLESFGLAQSRSSEFHEANLRPEETDTSKNVAISKLLQVLQTPTQKSWKHSSPPITRMNTKQVLNPSGNTIAKSRSAKSKVANQITLSTKNFTHRDLKQEHIPISERQNIAEAMKKTPLMRKNSSKEKQRKLKDIIDVYSLIRRERVKSGESVDKIDRMLSLYNHQLQQNDSEIRDQPETMVNNLYNLLADYEEIKKQQLLDNMDTSEVEKIIALLEQQVGIFNPKQPTNVEARCNEFLGQVFENFADGKAYMNYNEFMQFCVDFRIVKSKFSSSSCKLSKKTLENIFDQVSNLHRELTPELFRLTVKNISDCYYDMEYDMLHSTDFHKLPPSKKMWMFCEEIGGLEILIDQARYNRKSPTGLQEDYMSNAAKALLNPRKNQPSVN